MTEPIRLLHLSDIHFRTGTTWDSDPVLRALASFIGREVRAGMIPDLVVVTGDLAFSGKTQEYALAQQWLEDELWPVLSQDATAPLPRDRLLLVPGNHDVDRDAVDFMVEAAQGALLNGKDQPQIAKVLADDRQRTLLLDRHAAYLRFYADWLGEPQPLPWWRRRRDDLQGQSLHIAGLDSAWMACGDTDRGRLLLSRYQIHQTALAKEAEGAQWRLALLHHPWGYLAEFDELEARPQLHLHRDLILRGHLHEGEAALIRSPDPTRSCLELAAGCAYENSRYPNAFQWIELRPDPRRVRVHFRCWNKGAWQVDRNQPNCPDGTTEIPMDEPEDPLPGAKTGSPPSIAPIPADYLAWLRRTYGGIDLLGQDLQQGRSVTLSQVYCPAVTTPVRMPEPSQMADRGDTPPPLLLERLDASSLYCPAPPGAGKTTFCRWAVLQSIPGAETAHPVPPPKGYLEPMPRELRQRLPVLVSLREFWKGMDCGHGRQAWSRPELERALAAWLDRASPGGLTGSLFLDYLAAGRAFLLLDGLDEVPVSPSRDGTTLYPRSLLLTGLADALPHWKRIGNRVLLTSRPYGLDEAGLARLGLDRAPLEPLPEALQRLFVERWFRTLDQPELAEGLSATIAERDDLVPLAENPLLLTALCVIYGNGRRLPEDRYHLYQRLVDNVLYSRYPGDARQREPVKARLEAIAHGMHSGEGLGEDRRAPQPEASGAELERLLCAFARLEPAYETGRVEPAVQREELLTRSGLLLPRPEGRAAFYHLSFQEYLAAERIARTSEDRAALERVFRERAGIPEWRPTLLFLFAAQVFNYSNPRWGLDLLARLAADLDRSGVQANPAPAVLVAEALDLCLAKAYAIPNVLTERFCQVCLEAIDDAIAIPARQTSDSASAGWATRAFGICAIRAPMSRSRRATISTERKRSPFASSSPSGSVATR